MTVEIRAPNFWGHSLKIVARDTARKRFPMLYFERVDTGLVGKSETGEPIPVDTVGRLVWGVPGCAGRFVFEGGPASLIARQIFPVPDALAEKAARLIEAVFTVLAEGE